MFKNVKAVADSLKEYKKIHHKRFFDKTRLNTLIKKCIYKTRYLWGFLIILTLLSIIPEDKTITNKFSLYFTIYGPQVLIFFVSMVAIIAIAIISYLIISDEYNDYLSKTYFNFKKVLRFFTIMTVLMVLFLLARTQMYYVKHYLVPPLESCSYIDFYGNELYKHSEIGSCPDLINIEYDYILATEESIVKFGVLTDQYYYSYEYGTIDKNIVRRNELIYLINDQQFDLSTIKSQTPIKETRQLNSYMENEFSSQTTIIENNLKQSTEVASKLMGQEIIVYYDENIYDEFMPIEKYRFTKQSGKISLNNNYSFTFDEFKFSEEYFGIYNQQPINLRTNEYKYYELDDERIPMLTKITNLNEVKYEFNFDKKTSRMIEQTKDNQLRYRTTIEKNEIGFVIKHFSYRRNKLNRFLTVNEYQDYCFNYKNDINQYDYLAVFNSKNISNCGENLIDRINPLFLEYKVFNKK